MEISLDFNRTTNSDLIQKLYQFLTEAYFDAGSETIFSKLYVYFVFHSRMYLHIGKIRLCKLFFVLTLRPCFSYNFFHILIAILIHFFH